MQELTGRTALVTGASGGLGRHIARALAAEGMHLAVSGCNLAALETLCDDLRPYGVRAQPVAADLAQPGAAEHLAQAATDTVGSVQLLVNNAGTAIASSFTRLSAEELERVIGVGLTAPVLLTRALLPAMLEAGEGHVVNVASLAGRGALPYGVAYAAAKWGLVGVTQSLRAEYADAPVGFSVVAPGYVTGAGIFARYQACGLRAPAVVGTTTPETVAQAVVRAVRRDLPEVYATPHPVRPLLALAVLAPRMAERLASRLGMFTYPREAARLDGRL